MIRIITDNASNMKKAFEFSIPSWTTEEEQDNSVIGFEEERESLECPDQPGPSMVDVEIEWEGSDDEAIPVWMLVSNELNFCENSSTHDEDENGSQYQVLAEDLRIAFNADALSIDLLEENSGGRRNSSGIVRSTSLRTSCTAHTLQLVVKDGLTSLSVTKSLNNQNLFTHLGIFYFIE